MLAIVFVQQLETFAYNFLAGIGDYQDIRKIVWREDRPDVTKMSKEELLSLVRRLYDHNFKNC